MRSVAHDRTPARVLGAEKGSGDVPIQHRWFRPRIADYCCSIIERSLPPADPDDPVGVCGVHSYKRSIGGSIHAFCPHFVDEASARAVVGQNVSPKLLVEGVEEDVCHGSDVCESCWADEDRICHCSFNGWLGGLVRCAQLWNASKMIVHDVESSLEELTTRFSEHGLYRKSMHQICEPMHFDATNNESHPHDLRSTPVIH
jgi:hypothetical protein